jgi:5-histidylcysteine sulfoxide synthase/putative 4-mercaptohistidine N1-methyltranferase
MVDSRNPNLSAGTAKHASSLEGWRQNLGRTNLSSLRGGWFTGKAPYYEVCPGVREDGTITSLLIPNLSTCSRKEVRDYFDNSWTITEILFSALAEEEAFYRPPYHTLRHPLILYYGHPAALYVNKLRVAGLIDSSIDWNLESLFETGVDEMSWDDMSKNEIVWPRIEVVHEFRKKVYDTVCGVIENHPDLDGKHEAFGQDHPLWALFMGFEHERIHIETTSVLIRELPIDLVASPMQWPALHPSAHRDEVALPERGRDYPEPSLVRVEPQTVEIGKPAEFPTYGWDNEYGHKTVSVSEFEVSSHLISNGDFYEFVSSGGYSDRQFWTAEGWNWRSFRNSKFPCFWVPTGPLGSHRYRLRTIFEIISMPWSWPAVVNYFEASAYCKWLSKQDGTGRHYRLMSEQEHQSIRKKAGISNFSMSTCPSNLDLRWGSESPVYAHPTEAGISDIFGNVWQWCEDDFNPLPEFRIHPYYDDFSTPCFDGEHKMILGGSFISTGDEASPWARFHFRPHFFQHAGFRVVSSSVTNGGGAVHIGKSVENPYETQKMLADYLLLHFGDSEKQMPFMPELESATRFPKRCADLVNEWAGKVGLTRDRALDVGCAVGGAAFELARSFAAVTAVDISQKFIETANSLKNNGELTFDLIEEGHITSSQSVHVDDAARNKVEFRRADACSLPPEFVDFDAVLIANVLCRISSPMSLLNRLKGERGVVKPGGLVVLTTPFTWMEEFTPKDVWLGGFVDHDGKPRFSLDGLKDVMSADFELLHESNMPLLIREHRRKYQLIFAQATVWQRRL